MEDLVLLSLAALARDSSWCDFADGTNRPALREGRQRVPDVDATYKRAVSLGAKAIGDPADMTWGDRVRGVKDTSGNTGWIATNKK